MQVAEERHSEVKLDVTDALIYVGNRAVVVEQRNGVERFKSVDGVTLGVGTCNTCAYISGVVVEHVSVRIVNGKSGVETYGVAESFSLVVAVLEVSSAHVGVDREQSVEEFRRKIDTDCGAVHLSGTDNTIIIGITYRYSVREELISTSDAEVVVA